MVPLPGERGLPSSAGGLQTYLFLHGLGRRGGERTKFWDVAG